MRELGGREQSGGSGRPGGVAGGAARGEGGRGAAARGARPEGGHAEPKRGTEGWGESALGTFALFESDPPGGRNPERALRQKRICTRPPPI
ncbi:hypothetical protein B1218_38260, partial [Pseudomonas ogarae]